MEASFVLPCKWCTHLQGLLLTASFLTCCHLPATAQITTELVPPHVIEGENVLIRINNLPENLTTLAWFRGRRIKSPQIGQYTLATNVTVLGPGHSGRETLYSNGSLQIYNVTQEDIGFYSLRVMNRHAEIVSITSIYLNVYSSFLTCCHLPTTAQITIELVPPHVIEGENVLIRINNLPENLTTLAWFRGTRIKSPQIGQYTLATNVTALGPGHSGRETLYSNGSLQIYNVTKEDIGFYSLRIMNRHAEIVSITSIYLNVYSSLWTCEHPSPHAKLTIESVPPSISEGGSVLLLVKNLPQNLLSLFWYKGAIAVKKFEVARHIKATNSSVPGPAHTGRETVYSNGSLLLQEVMQSDTGFYTLRTMSTDLKDEVAHVQLYMDTSLSTCYQLSQVKIESLPQKVAVGKSVLLLAYNLPEDFQAFFWYKSAFRRDTYKIAEYSRAMDTTIMGSAYSLRELIYTNGSMAMIDVTEDDAGIYMLEILREDFKIEKVYVQLLVNSFVPNSKDSGSTARLSIESVPPSIVEGESVLLLVHNLPKNLQSLFWYKGVIAEEKSELIQHIIATSSSLPGPAHSGRETVYSNGSLLLQRVMHNDTGFYTLRTISTDLKDEIAHVQLQLDTSLSTCCHHLQVKIESLPQNVAVGKTVLLLVHNLPEDFQAFFWYKSAYKRNTYKIAEYSRAMDTTIMGSAYSLRELIYTNGSMVMIDVTEDDAGIYMLEILREDFKIEKVYVQLLVNGFVPNSKDSGSTARFSIESVPPSIVEGESVLLLVHNLPKNLQSLFWYKGVIAEEKSELIQHIIATSSSLPGPAHSGRETVYSNGSMLLQRVMHNDTGFYTLRTISTDLKDEIAHVQLQLDTSTCCNLLSSDQLIIEPVPWNIAVGKSVLLLVCNVPEDVQTFFWYKSVYRTDIFKIAEYSRTMESTIWGLAHSGREMVYTNGSLLIQNVTEHDTGLYMLEILHKDYKLERAHVQVHVNNPVSWPFVRVTDTTVRVQSSVVFTCFSADPGVSIRWLFNKQSLQLTERMTLSPSKCQLSIDPVWREDAGKYQCEVYNPVSSKSSLPVCLSVMEE